MMTRSPDHPVFTIGHATHMLAEFATARRTRDLGVPFGTSLTFPVEPEYVSVTLVT